MAHHLRILLFLCLGTGPWLMAQPSVTFKTGVFNLLPIQTDARSSIQTRYHFYRSDHVLSTSERQILRTQGMEILYPLHNHLYWVRITKTLPQEVGSNLFDLDPAYKVGIDLQDRSSDHGYRLTVPQGMKEDVLRDWAGSLQIQLLDLRGLPFGFVDVRADEASIASVRETPWVCFIGQIPKDEEVQYRAHHGERAWGLTSALDRNLDGSGITVGIGDGGRLGLHEDLKNDYIDLATFLGYGVSNHATQVSGIITGAGLIDPFYGRGYAPKAYCILRNFSDILLDSPQYIEDFGMSLTNNSYGTSLDNCTYFGDYDGTSAALDAMVETYPQLLHVFAAANSGGMTCSPYPIRYATIAGGYQPAKNLLTVGAVGNTDANASFSSRGPVDDGRLKPELVAYGAGRFSTMDNNQYGSNSGTSFSSPATAGIATLLYQRYRQLHNDSLPDAALIKNVLCNAADDLGTTGPDYTYGFGRINGVRAAEILESGHFTSLMVDQQDTLIRTFSVPSGIAFADVMLMWTDPASAPFETVTLVNDLDLKIVTPAGDTLKPWKLNYTPTGVASAATTGADHLNNYEQVTVPSPVSGVYTIVVTGYLVPMGPQKAWLSWDLAPAGIRVTGPNGGEVLKPGNSSVANDRQYIRWDAFGTGTSTFTVDYSIDGGSSWIVLATNIPAGQSYQDWFPPSTPTDQLKVRVTASNSMSDVSDQNATIMSAPASLAATSPCNGYVQVSWNSVAGATSYKIFTIKNETLTQVATTTATSIVLSDFPYDSAVWVTVAGALTSGATGLRARAVTVTANGGNNCGWANDLRLDSLISFSSGRLFTTSAHTTADSIRVRITNTGTAAASGFALHYAVNNTTPIDQNFSGTLNPGAGQNFTFSQTANLATAGTYSVKVWLTYASDPNVQNDTIIKVVRQLINPAITLPWTEGFESIRDTTITGKTIGISQLQAWDAYPQSNARIRTFAGQPFTHDGDRALTVDAIRSGTSKNADLIMTLNLSAYNVMNDDIRLNLYVMHHEIIPDGTNQEAIWVRGSDAGSFVLLTYISNDASLRGQWQYLSGLNLTAALNSAGQNFSSSFQIKFSHGVYASAGQLTSEDGQTIDDISIHIVQGDITIASILQPAAISCDLGVDTIKINITNTSALPVTNTVASYRVNDSTIYDTPVGTIAANSTKQVSLLPPYDFSMPGDYTVKVWVNSADDNFHFNDTTSVQVLHTPLIDTYPYAEGFENGDGGWLSGGIHNTWQVGVPGKETISRAAEGSQACTTSLSGTYHADEMSYLYSPCFDLNGLSQPWLSFAFQFQLETGFDYAWVEYRVGNSNTWTKLGVQGSGVNWYNQANHTWNGTQSTWVTTGYAIPVTNTVVQFRWVMSSDVGLEMEGVAVDQVHVYDRKPQYTGSNMQWTFLASGNDWIHLDQGGQRVFSILPLGQDLGTVTLNLYKAAGNFHLSDSLYLLSRNWVISSSMPPSGPVLLRAYFTKDEATNLVNATGCTECVSARDGFDLAALRYDGPNQDGNYANDVPAQVTTYPLDSVNLLPFDNGFVAEWSTDSFSEWWITTNVTQYTGSITRAVSGSSDDAEEHQDNGSVNPVRESLTLTDRDGHQYVGWRFRNITIPKGSFISSAHLEWMCKDTSSMPVTWTLQSESVADATGFTTSKYNLSLRTRAPKAVQWTPGSWTLEGATYTSPDLRLIVQQVVDQPSWVNGNDLVLLMQGSGHRDAWSYDGDPLKGARLLISYDSACITSGICYVDSATVGLQNGSSWANACRSLDQALDLASRCPDITQIWVARGTYTPFAEAGRNAGFVIPPGINIYGGFQGTETSIGQRVYGAYPTIISGDVGLAGISTDNLYHVITMQAGAEGALLDGVTIRLGLANGATVDLQRGSGINNLGQLTTYQVRVENCSPLPVYNAPGSLLETGISFDIRQ